jgi:hypothetical protein
MNVIYYLIMHLLLYKFLSSNSPLVYKVAVDVEDGQHRQAKPLKERCRGILAAAVDDARRWVTPRRSRKGPPPWRLFFS